MTVRPLSAGYLDRYRDNGILHPLSAIGRESAAHYRGFLESFEAAYGVQARAILRHKGHLVLTWLNDLMRHPIVISAVREIIGPDILCWTSNVFLKDPGDSKFVPWHQDATYWGLGGERVVTAWIALTPSTPLSGCMRVVPGSHRWNQVRHVDTFHQDSLLTRGQEIEVHVDETEAEDVVLSPGEMSLHHVLVAHASGPNRSTERRIGIAFRYIAADVKQLSGLRDTATLIAGVDRFAHFDLEPSPSRDMAPAALEYWTRITQENARILYRGAEQMPGNPEAKPS